VKEKVATLRPWDAGTDNGTTYTSPNRDARPQRPIAPLEGDPVAFEGAVAPFGTFTFRRVR
jgi:Spondin_N